MLIRFAVSNYLSFNEKTELSLEAGRIRNHAERIYKNRRLKLVKCEALFGPNASGKSNLIQAINFFKSMMNGKFPTGSSNKYFKLNSDNKDIPSLFEIEVICGDQRFCYGFTILLRTGSIIEEWLYEITPTGLYKYLYTRNTDKETFKIGEYFKKNAITYKLEVHGEDTAEDRDILFLNYINKSRGKMFAENPDIRILSELYSMFTDKINITTPNEVLTCYPLFRDIDIQSIAGIFQALGLGISDMRIIEITLEEARRRIPGDEFRDVISDLDELRLKAIRNNSDYIPAISIRYDKEFYTFIMDYDGSITIQTIQLVHENSDATFSLEEESDGTVRLLDIVEILFRVPDDTIYIIDEIDRALHPLLTEKLITLFLKMAEERNTQLIMTTHAYRLLRGNILRKDEISFITKNTSGSTQIRPFRLSDHRTDKSVYDSLFDGELDAIPKIDNDLGKKI